MNLQIVLALFSAAIVIVGWRVIYRNALRVATRNETFTLIRDILATIDKLREEGCALWQAETAHEVEFAWKKLGPDLAALRRSIYNLDASRSVTIPISQLVSIRRALSMNLEEAGGRDPDKATQNVAQIFETSQEFKHQVLKAFAEKYPPKT
ncbi:hypothetical protein E2F43_18205 [Seongchinamella unica]|uniref:Uncharacterized protein n=1 Tax=Seongchinamella unica TaxID=2547392 RepID=A0A4R5LND8_9GAMM|nr:hypothetical protein [Seongchinamella unica]TDG11644.1 hypothetical protein E2F43_18205 [Seongchinamella unica]